MYLFVVSICPERNKVSWEKFKFIEKNRFTLYPTYTKFRRGNLLLRLPVAQYLRHCVINFLLSELKNENKSNPTCGIQIHNRRVHNQTLCCYATIATSFIYIFSVYLTLVVKGTIRWKVGNGSVLKGTVLNTRFPERSVEFRVKSKRIKIK